MDDYFQDLKEQAFLMKKHLGQNADIVLIMNMIITKELLDELKTNKTTITRKTTTTKK